MAKKIMIQGTMSNSGKSFLAAALCRIFHQDGYRTAPFKSQNMALNSYITDDGLEIGRAQAMQAEAAGILPSAEMNPILLKPTSHMGSQVVIMGEVFGNMKAMDYYRRKPELIPVIKDAFARLEEQYEVIVLEGAGSPAEINLRENDIVNMGMAEMADAPVLLVGDIDRGGVLKLLSPQEQRRIRGLIINKFRGDVEILKPGLDMIEEKVGIPVVGVIPMEQIDLDDEDSLSERLDAGKRRGYQTEAGDEQPYLDLAVIHLPHISNFTDFNPLEQGSGARLRYVSCVSQLGQPDLLILPGTKNTMADLAWMRENGLEEEVIRLVEEKKIPLIGICGGYQMLGEGLQDPEGAEGVPGSSMKGMGLLHAETIFASRKTRTRITGRIQAGSGIFSAGQGSLISGYEIHMGITRAISSEEHAKTAVFLEDGRRDGLCREDGLVFGTYLHGLFDNEEWTGKLLSDLAEKKGILWSSPEESRRAYKERQYDRLAQLGRENLDMKKIYEIMGMDAKNTDETKQAEGELTV